MSKEINGLVAHIYDHENGCVKYIGELSPKIHRVKMSLTKYKELLTNKGESRKK